MLAAERTGRQARLIELEPRYVDVTIRRWEKETGKQAIHAENGRVFTEIEAGEDNTPSRDHLNADSESKEVAHG